MAKCSVNISDLPSQLAAKLATGSTRQKLPGKYRALGEVLKTIGVLPVTDAKWVIARALQILYEEPENRGGRRPGSGRKPNINKELITRLDAH